MNSKLMIVLAGVMLVGAIIAGYLGYKASAQPQKVAMSPAQNAAPANGRPAADNGRFAVVIAGRELLANAPIKPEDLYIEHMRQVPPQSYGRVEELVGKRPMVTIPVGAMVTEAAMLPGGDLSKLVKPGERAMAIGVDEVVGGGGFVRPGDFVDVLLYAKGQGGSRERVESSAQLVLSALRVISYGPRLAPTAVEPGTQNNKEEPKEEGSVARTAVLAVPELQMTKLVLASNEGVLRLAVRSAQEAGPATGDATLAKAGKPEAALPDAQRLLITASALLPGRSVATPAPVQRVASSKPSVKRTTVQAAPKSSVVIQRGNSVQQQLLP